MQRGQKFAKKCYDTSITRLKMDKTISDNVADWSNDNVDKFLLLVESYVQNLNKILRTELVIRSSK